MFAIGHRFFGEGFFRDFFLFGKQMCQFFRFDHFKVGYSPQDQNSKKKIKYPKRENKFPLVKNDNFSNKKPKKTQVSLKDA
jgi:hypothetical protein